MQRPLTWTDADVRRVVVMGCGRTGASIVTALSQEGCPVIVIDVDPDAFGLLPPGTVGEGYIVPILADGTLEEDLRKASTQDADVFVALSGSDMSNALAAQIAKHLLQVPTVICRMNDPTRKEMYHQLGLVTISATTVITDMILEAAGR